MSSVNMGGARISDFSNAPARDPHPRPLSQLPPPFTGRGEKNGELKPSVTRG